MEIFIVQVRPVAVYQFNGIAGSIYCNGRDSCVTTTITGSNNVYCLAADACDGAVIRNVGNSVYGYGEESLFSADIQNVKNSVFCVSGDSCVLANVANISTMYAIGDKSFESGTLTNVNKIAYFIGLEIASSSIITNVEKILASGNRALYSAKITGFRELKINSTNGLSISTIITGYDSSYNYNSTNDDVIVIIAGDNEFPYNVYCNQSDNCLIKCQSTNACSMMSLYCFGNCSVECDEKSVEGISCPNANGNTSYKIIAPMATMTTTGCVRPHIFVCFGFVYLSV